MKPLSLPNTRAKLIAKDERSWEDFHASYISYCNLLSNFPEPYTWKYDSDIVLETKMIKALDALKINQIFWTDLHDSIGAAEQIFYRRSYTLLNSALNLTEADDFLSAAILSRSLLELAIWHVYHSSIFELTISDANYDPNRNLVDAVGMQELILKLIWGTNKKEAQEAVKQHKVIKVCEKVAKSLRYHSENEMKLELIYDNLCEYVHPNVEGNNLFVNFDINGGLKPSLEVELEISLYQNFEKSVDPLKTMIIALTWCMSATAYASNSYGSARRLIVEKFGLNSTKHRKLN
jgi:hypothetical protein